MKKIVLLIIFALGLGEHIQAETITYNCVGEKERFQFTVSDEDYSLISLEYFKEDQSYVADLKTIDMRAFSLWETTVSFDIALLNFDENMRLFVRFPKVNSNCSPIVENISALRPHFDRFKQPKLMTPRGFSTVPTAYAALLPTKSKSIYLQGFTCTISMDKNK